VNLSFEEVLSKPFFTGEKSAPLVIPVAKPPKPTTIMAPKKKFQSPTDKKAAMARAIAVMKAAPKKQRPMIRRK
jgi:hypothetical protein